ncbi:hypothetical protein MN116_006354 [Schistosoma mekongi]|uniref:ETS domain-containing protein n=1 Tax=Schistosoma mekongi TaxID=38744 RepID=A0AAE1ZBE6_SCHME|nr:hypothetical protein MN116_006354 [Schistosoma mekongi]
MNVDGDVQSLTTCDDEIDYLSMKRSRLNSHSTELTNSSTTLKRTFMKEQENKGVYDNNSSDMNYVESGIKLTSNDDCIHQDVNKASLSTSTSSSPIPAIITQQTTSVININDDQSNLHNQNKITNIDLLNDSNESQIPPSHFQLNDRDSEDYTTEIDGSNGKLTLWQFLLELLLSNKYEHIIRWTNKRGEFILVQAEIVAKLWGMRKDKNHRMNYDKLSRALRYYYQKNIIRKVHGRKFVYQFIGLKHLIKFCCTSLNSTPITTSVTTSIMTTSTVITSIPSTCKSLQQGSLNNTLAMHSKMEDSNFPVTTSLYHCNESNELRNHQHPYHHHHHQHKEWFNSPIHSVKLHENERDCKYTASSNTTKNDLNTISTNTNHCTLTPMLTEPTPNLTYLNNNNSIHNSATNFDIKTISAFINSYLNKSNFEMNPPINNNVLPEHSGQSTSKLIEQNPIEMSSTSNEVNDLTDFISSWASIISQSNYVNNYQLIECFKESSSLLMNPFNYHKTFKQFNIDQLQQQNQIHSSANAYCTTGQNDSMLRNKQEFLRNHSENPHLMHKQSTDQCPINLRSNYSAELSKIEDTQQYDEDNSIQFTRNNSITLENLFFQQSFNQSERPRSPCCECSCHFQFITNELNYPLIQNMQQITPSCLQDIHKHSNNMETLTYYTNKQMIDKLPAKLHNERHSINMKRLSEQLTRLNRLNSIGNYSLNNSSVNTNKSTPMYNFTKSNFMNDEQTTYNGDINSNDYHCPIDVTSTDLKMTPNLNLYNNIVNDDNNKTDTTSIPENKCVWMPVPVTMLNSWFNLLSNIKYPNDNKMNDSNFIIPTSSSSSSSSSSAASSMSSTS